MRPPEFTGGNVTRGRHCIHEPSQGAQRFNEAAGIHRRKRAGGPSRLMIHRRCFNEAAGIHRRKRIEIRRHNEPPEFTGGNAVIQGTLQ